MAIRRFQATLSPTIIATISASEQSFNIGATDLNLNAVVTVNKPTQQAGLAIAQGRVVSATNVAITFVNPTAAGITPTAGECYQFVIVD